MDYSYWRTERLILDAVGRRILQRPTGSDRIISVLANPDLLIVAGFCIAGLLATLALLLAVPSFTELNATLQF